MDVWLWFVVVLVRDMLLLCSVDVYAAAVKLLCAAVGLATVLGTFCCLLLVVQIILSPLGRVG